MDGYLDELNQEQLQAVMTTEGPVRVIAGAGSGKTRALTHRFAYLVNELGILPGNILCVTFTNKAAQEMRRRIHDLTGDNDTGFINTFHGFCVSVLDEESYAVQYPRSFLVLDNSDIDSMLRIIYEERGLTLRDMSFKNARDMIEIEKIYRRPDYYEDMITMSAEVLKEKYLRADNVRDIIFYGYLYQEKKCFGLDYNDLIFFTLYIFRENPDIRLKWQQRLEYIMIDEFQDIDEPQYKLMDVLAGYHKNLFIVGDPDQTIYTWRGANTRYLMEFDKTHQGTETIMMNRNYRSAEPIVRAVNSLISRNEYRIKKDLIAQRPGGAKPLCTYSANAQEEASSIAVKIDRMISEGISPGDIAVLYRAHYLTRSIEEAFMKEKIAYHIYSGVQFFDRAEIKDALSYLRMAALKDDLSFRRIVNIPKRSIGKSRMAFIEDYAQNNSCSLYRALEDNLGTEMFRGTGAAKFIKLIEHLAQKAETAPVSELLTETLDKSGYEAMLRTEGSQERLDNLAELKQSVYEYETSCGEEAGLVHYLEHVALYSNAEEPEDKGRVKLMTVHAAKGLEFPYVFLAGMNEDIFPSKKTSTLAAMEEERRLAFVAMTRARDGLFISEAGGRTLDGAPRYPSRFILDIDPELTDVENPPAEDLIKAAENYAKTRLSLMPENLEQTMFSAGDRIRHSVFGEGSILSTDTKLGVYVIKFDSLDSERRINVRARLSKAGDNASC